MSTFGKKNRSEWTGADNATHAMSVMLGAELREKADKATQTERMIWVCGAAALFGLVVGIILVVI